MTTANWLYSRLTLRLRLNPPAALIAADMMEDLSGLTTPQMKLIYRNSLKSNQYFKTTYLGQLETAVW